MDYLSAARMDWNHQVIPKIYGSLWQREQGESWKTKTQSWFTQVFFSIGTMSRSCIDRQRETGNHVCVSASKVHQRQVHAFRIHVLIVQLSSRFAVKCCIFVVLFVCLLSMFCCLRTSLLALGNCDEHFSHFWHFTETMVHWIIDNENNKSNAALSLSVKVIILTLNCMGDVTCH